MAHPFLVNAAILANSLAPSDWSAEKNYTPDLADALQPIEIVTKTAEDAADLQTTIEIGTLFNKEEEIETDSPDPEPTAGGSRDINEGDTTISANELVKELGITGLNADQMLQVEKLRDRLDKDFKSFTEDFLEQNISKFQWEDKIHVFMVVIDDIRQSLTKQKWRSPDGKNWWEVAGDEMSDELFDAAVVVIGDYKKWFTAYWNAHIAETNARSAESIARSAESIARSAESIAEWIQIFVSLHKKYTKNPDKMWLNSLQAMIDNMEEGKRDLSSVSDILADIEKEKQKHPERLE